MSNIATIPTSFRAVVRPWRVGLAAISILAAIALFDPAQAGAAARFAASAALAIAPFLLASVILAAWAQASGADAMIARAFSGNAARMITMAALFGALSPFCSCGVIPLIAALLAMGVPLAPVMAFWLASPIMDPEMFVLTWGILGLDFGLAKTAAAIGIGLAGGTVTHLLAAHLGPESLRNLPGPKSCAARAQGRARKPIVWAFWKEEERAAVFRLQAARTLMMLGQWLLLAFVLESLMLRLIPAEAISTHLGGSGLMPIVLATVAAIPAYLNGYAALPLVEGLLGQGLQPGAAMAFLVAGGVTSIPAAMAVWALVRPRVFALYLALATGGALLSGLLFNLAA
ncbi:permease [Frigidibacter sp. RF13]|uniref:permease n=1 Tax=Frigidibacter sp. RF13 TaxID=2997340 RepID=UPI00226DF23D|nr:permease [Frigidibacter sp. RF13]MCY1127632.1 permease [Frigidibacter sp. RF13]